MYKAKLILLITISFLIFQSCDDKLTSTNPTTANEAPSELNSKSKAIPSVMEANNFKKIDAQLKQLAKLTAIALQDVELRKALASEIEKQQTGDYEALYSSLRKYKIDGRSFTGYMSQLIKKYSNNNQLSQRLHSLLGTIPKLHFAMPVNFEKWDPVNYVPIVTYAPNYNDGGRSSITAYNANGDQLKIDYETPPEKPVIVVGVNERVGTDFISVDRKSEELEYSPMYVQPCTYCGGGGDGSEPEPKYRVEGARDYIEKIKAIDLGQWEPWIRGKLELWLQVGYGKGEYNEDRRWDIKRGDLKDGDDTYIELRSWYTNLYSEVSAYVWRERDSGNTYTFTFGYTYTQGGHEVTVGFEFKAQDGDEHIGTTVVHFNDPARKYDLVDFDFWLNFHN